MSGTIWVDCSTFPRIPGSDGSHVWTVLVPRRIGVLSPRLIGAGMGVRREHQIPDVGSVSPDELVD